MVVRLVTLHLLSDGVGLLASRRGGAASATSGAAS
jgi:hypothetical protein